MFFWSLLATISALYGVIQNFLSKIFAEIRYKLALITITVFYGFRYMIGNDYESYLLWFSICDIDDIYPEYSFRFLVKILTENGFDFQMLFLIYSTLTIIFLWRGIGFYIKDIYAKNLAVIFFILMTPLYWDSFSTIRQSLAMTIFFWGSKYIIEKKFLKYLCAILLASFIHYTGIVLLFVYFLKNKKYTKYQHIMFILISIVLCYFEFMIPVVEYLINSFGLEHYNDYTMSQNVWTSVGFGVIFQGILSIIIIWYRKYDKDNLHEFVYNMYTMSFVFYYIFYFFPPLARMNLYFRIFHIIAVAYFIYSFQRKNIKFTMMVGILIAYMLIILHNISLIPNFTEGVLNPFFSANNIDYQFNFKLLK